MGRYRQIQADVGRCTEVQGDTGRYRQIQADVGRYRLLAGEVRLTLALTLPLPLVLALPLTVTLGAPAPTLYRSLRGARPNAHRLRRRRASGVLPLTRPLPILSLALTSYP